MIIGAVVAVVLAALLINSLTGGGKKSRFNVGGDDYFQSSHRHNGEMPDFSLAPYRLFGPALRGVGLVIFLVTALLTGWALYCSDTGLS